MTKTHEACDNRRCCYTREWHERCGPECRCRACADYHRRIEQAKK